METLKKNFPTFNWDAYFTTSGLNDLKEVNIGQPAAMKEVADVINTVPLEDQKFYLQWNLIDAAASFLSDDFVAQNFDFYSRTMSGKKEMQPRWKRAVSTVDGSLGEVVGQMYVEKYFPAAAKERMVGLVKNLQTSLGERIKALEWMSEPTKVKALEKLATFHVKIGYPDKWKDYSALEIKDDSYWANIERASQWDFNDMIAKAGKPVDKDEWLMTPQTVNAYYNPTTNEICFPAAILQAPFFDMNADDAMNYGAIGVVIGHEMTHGFDDQGRQYDKDGNLKDWWTEEDAKKFEERAQVMVNFFDSIEVAPGVHANGELTLGENIADHGGLQVSFAAFKKAMETAPLEVVDGFTPEQRFFLICAMPELMILDEPMDGLDPVMRRQIWSIILSKASESRTTILISSHNLRELEDVCDHVGIMHKGKIIVERSLSDLQGNVSKIQVAFQEGMPTLPKDFEILHMSNTGRVYTLIVKGNPERAKMILEETHPMLIDILPLTLEEIFIYEMGGKNYEIKDILF